MPKISSCPTLESLENLAAGRLSPAKCEALLEHLEECECCGQHLSDFPQDDTLLALIRQSKTLKAVPAREIVGPLIEKIRKLRPWQRAQRRTWLWLRPRQGA
jgi:hypothetical protein